VLTIAALSGPLPKLGVIAAALLAGWVILATDHQQRAWAMLGALVLAPVLLLADIWSSPQLRIVHRHPLEAVVAAAAIVVVLVFVAAVLVRQPGWLAPLAMLALPFRVPISISGTTSNLLVPLYFVVAAGSLAWIFPRLLGGRGSQATTPATPTTTKLFEKLVALFLVLYAVQAIYSSDFAQALQNMAFFYVPFALLFVMLRGQRWDRELLMRCLAVTAALALVFAGIGFIEEATKRLLLNPKLVAVNDVHVYFTVNSVFFDPDIFGRYLAMVMILLVGVLLYERGVRLQAVTAVVLLVLWCGLVFTLSRSSLLALAIGMATLAALRWRAVKPVLGAAAAIVAIGAVVLIATPTTFGLNQGLNGASSGRANLVTGGVSMFGSRPIWGYGSGSFETEYTKRYPYRAQIVSASHTISVTVASEQGLIGLLVYFALVITAVVALLRGAGADPARAAVGAAFFALMVHTWLYADFLEDPVTWVLLALGSALLTQSHERVRAAARSAQRQARGVPLRVVPGGSAA
jgi:putative inorganic carbon (HCO3(-)) transporter